MLTILKTDNQAEIAAYCKKHSLKLPTLPAQYMGIYNGESLCGLGAITLDGAKVYLDFMHAEDGSSMLYGLAKALLNMADLRGIPTVYGRNPELEQVYTLLRFTKEENEFRLSLAGYFTAENHC